MTDTSQEMTQQMQFGAKIVAALNECHPEIADAARDLLKQLASGELDDYESHATTALIAEMLFPNCDEAGHSGLDIDEMDAIAMANAPEATPVIEALDDDEEAFAANLKDAMKASGLTQVQLAEKIGVGQPAISMMLNRKCYPQESTVLRLAEALGVTPQSLLPSFGSDD